VSFYERADLAKLYRTHERGLSVFVESTRNLDPDVSKALDTLMDLLVEKADELWPRPASDGMWSVSVVPESPGIVVIKTRAKGEGEARIWLREALGLGYALKQIAKHEIAQSGGTT
jgi:hypothetical protein